MDGAHLALELAYQTALYADYRTSRYIVQHPETFHESNPLLGRHPSMDKLKLACAFTAVGHWAISEMIPDRYRNAWQGVTLSLQVGVVSNNLAIGLRF